jgi:phosphohistidine phosphatase
MQLYLVQHAAAKSKEMDPERPLSEQGWVDIRKVAAYMAKHADIKLSRIYHSGKTRAQQTAEVLAQALNPAQGIEEAEGLTPKARPSIWVNRLADLTEDVMLVGHLPHMSKLASSLLAHDDTKHVVEFQQGGIVCLRRDEAGDWFLRWMVIPEIVE